MTKQLPRILLILAICTIPPLAFGQSAVSNIESPSIAATFDDLAEDHFAAADQRLARDIKARLARLDTLANVRVEARSGVAMLSGEVVEEADIALSETIARAVPGVVEVRNAVQATSNIRLRLAPTLDRAALRIQRLLSSLPLLVIACMIVWLANVAGRRLAKADVLYRRVAADNAFLRNVLRQVVRALALIIGLLIALELLGATAMVGALLGTAGVVGLAVGFAFKDIVENYIASILLSVRQPFAPNDHVLISGEEGKVVSLTPRATVLIGMDGTVRMLPNAAVFKSVIVNFSRNPQRRFEFELGVRPGQPLASVQVTLVAALNAIDGVLFDPPPAVFNVDYGDSRVTLLVRAWVDQRKHSLDKVRSQAVRLCACALDADGIAWPESTLRITRGDSSSALVETTPDVGQMADDTSIDTYLDEHASAQRKQLPDEDLLHDEPVTAAPATPRT